jgi:aspartate/methionine/tyrosine aminotransferase
MALADEWLRDVGVAVTPGLDFDPTEGHRFVRLSYSESPDDIEAAIKRLDSVIRGRV